MSTQGMTADPSEFGRNVYVASLPIDFNDEQLFNLFAPYGPISSARIMRSKGTRQSKGYGFVLYKNPRSAELAIANLVGHIIDGNRIQVRLAHPDASVAYGGNSRSANSTPSTRPLPPPQSSPLSTQIQLSPPLSQIQLSPPLSSQIQLSPALASQIPQTPKELPLHPSDPSMMMAAPYNFPAIYPAMYPPMLGPGASNGMTGVFPSQVMFVPQFPSPQVQQMPPHATYYMVVPDA